jgi:hypothetical protein
MGEFYIEFVPPLPPAELGNTKVSLEEIDYDKVMDAYPFEEHYDILYYINGEQYRYYPNFLLAVFSDIYNEWEKACKRESHEMTISGSPISVTLEYEGERARFYDECAIINSANKKLVRGMDFDANAVEHSFKYALDKLWALILQTQ